MKSRDEINLSKEVWVDENVGAGVRASLYCVPPKARSRIEEAADAFLNAAAEILKGLGKD